jgi:hypothetical protein
MIKMNHSATGISVRTAISLFGVPNTHEPGATLRPSP